MTIIIDICIIVAVVVFLATTTYAYVTHKIDDMYKRLYLKERDYTEYLYKQLTETEKKLKETENKLKEIEK